MWLIGNNMWNTEIFDRCGLSNFSVKPCCRSEWNARMILKVCFCCLLSSKFLEAPNIFQTKKFFKVLIIGLYRH